MTADSCPHCGALRSPDAAFCESCGKALPSPMPAGPRIVTSGERANSSAGLVVQSEDLHSQVKKAAGALLAVAILQALFGTCLLLAGPMASEFITIEGSQTAVFVSVYGIAVLFFGLYLWARKSPFPATRSWSGRDRCASISCSRASCHGYSASTASSRCLRRSSVSRKRRAR